MLKSIHPRRGKKNVNSSSLRSSNSPAESAKKDDRDTELRSKSPGYSSIQTCLCIKMDFCDFTLEHFLDSLRTNRPLFPDLASLFDNLSSFVNFKPEKGNQKFGAFSPLYIICQLLEGLIFIHNLGIVHRDLKPANIFIMQVDTILQFLISKLEILYLSGWTGEDRRLRSLLRPLRGVRPWSASRCRHKVDLSLELICGIFRQQN